MKQHVSTYDNDFLLMNNGSLVEMLLSHPQLFAGVPLEKLNELKGHHWSSLLAKHPKFIDQCDLSKLNGWQWVSVLRYSPSLIDKADLSKIDQLGWKWLLQHQPSLADRPLVRMYML